MASIKRQRYAVATADKFKNGTPRDPVRVHAMPQSFSMPHQGRRECARRAGTVTAALKKFIANDRVAIRQKYVPA